MSFIALNFERSTFVPYWAILSRGLVGLQKNSNKKKTTRVSVNVNVKTDLRKTAYMYIRV